MRRSSGVGVILLLAIGFVASPGFAQTVGGPPPDARDRGTPEFYAFPNPFNPETTIRFHLEDELFENRASVPVTIRILNVLGQPVATPTALNHTDRPGAPVEALPYYAPGTYDAFWDGRDSQGREVSSGVYYAALQIPGQKLQVQTLRVQK